MRRLRSERVNGRPQSQLPGKGSLAPKPRPHTAAYGSDLATVMSGLAHSAFYLIFELVDNNLELELFYQ